MAEWPETSRSRPLVSVILPFRDAARTLPTAIRSILRQSYRRFELVAVDDGSCDSGAAWVEAAARREPRLKLYRQPRLGLCAALRLALESSHGELIARMDADDISLRTRLEEQVEYLRANPELAVAGCQFRLVPRHLVTDGMRRYESWSNQLLDPSSIRRDLFVESPLCHPTVMARAPALRAVGGYNADCESTKGAWPEDYDLWLRLDEAGHVLGKLPRMLLLWRESASRLSRVGAAYRPESFFALKLEHLQRRLRGRRVLVWGAGREGKPWLRALAARDLLDELAVDVDPRKLGQRIHGRRVIAPPELGPPRDDRLVLVAVGSPGARQQIRAFLAAAGFRELDHFICVA